MRVYIPRSLSFLSDYVRGAKYCFLGPLTKMVNKSMHAGLVGTLRVRSSLESGNPSSFVQSQDRDRN
jgi:hypothetical protein